MKLRTDIHRFMLAVASLAIVVTMAGCATYPLGLSREEWQALTSEEQAEVRAREEAEKAERERRAEEDRLAREQLIRARYDAPEYGDMVRVTIKGGELMIFNDSFSYHPVSFDLVRGENKMIKIPRIGRRTQPDVSFEASLSDDGNTFYFDDGSFNRITLINRNWDSGQMYAPPKPTTTSGIQLIGATFYIKYRNLSGSPIP